MSLFTPSSQILRLIMEAEEFKVSPEQMQLPEMPDADGTGIGDVASELSVGSTNATPVSNQPGTGAMQIANIPQPTADVSTTLSKTVINAEILLSQLSELKSVINNYEKKFDGEDLTVDAAKVYVGSLLNTLIYHAEKLQSFLGLPSANQEEPTVPDTMPDTMPNTGMEEMPLEDQEMPSEPDEKEMTGPILPEDDMGNDNFDYKV